MTAVDAAAALTDRIADRAAALTAIALLAALFLLAKWVRRREWVRFARDRWQASHDRPEAVRDPQGERPQCSHGVLLSEGRCPLCEAMPKGPPHCGYWCEKTPAGRCRDRCVELMEEGT